LPGKLTVVVVVQLLQGGERRRGHADNERSRKSYNRGLLHSSTRSFFAPHLPQLNRF